MNAISMLQQQLHQWCPTVDRTRLAALMTSVEALVTGQTLTVTALGRHSPRDSKTKHAIKQADRLIGNPHLYAQRDEFYRALTHQLLRHQSRPGVLIDWSDCPDNRALVLLRASVPVGGRAVTLYEEVHPIACLGNPKVQRQFLAAFATILPTTSRPIIITDAGFLVPWFREVTALGWDFIGRIRPSMQVSFDDGETWEKGATAISATARPRYLGVLQIAKSNPCRVHLYSLNDRPKGRKQRTRFGQDASSEHHRKYAHRAQLPWIIASSLDDGLTSKRAIALYRTRMQIEESFRDLKSTRTGFAWTQTRCRCLRRTSNLLLIAVIAGWLIMFIGRLAEQQGKHIAYQANTQRKRRVLYIAFLGQAVLIRERLQIKRNDLPSALNLMRLDAKQQCALS